MATQEVINEMVNRGNEAMGRGRSYAEGVRVERERCLAILSRARLGEIDTDLRAIRARIESGMSANED